MRLAVRLLRPAANVSGKAAMWQDPVWGYWESHGKMEFVAGEQYDMSEAQKLAVLERYKMKEVLKKEFLRREFDPIHFRYKEGITMDPAMFRWYATDMTQVEHFRWTPKSVFTILGGIMLVVFIYFRIMTIAREKSDDACVTGELLWWDRISGRYWTEAGNTRAGT